MEAVRGIVATAVTGISHKCKVQGTEKGSLFGYKCATPTSVTNGVYDTLDIQNKEVQFDEEIISLALEHQPDIRRSYRRIQARPYDMPCVGA